MGQFSRIGIIGAMASEVEQLQVDMDNAETHVSAGMTFYAGSLCGQDVVVVQSGFGKVCAAVCVEILIGAYRCDAIVNAGVAGSLDARIDIGDVVVATDVIHHDMDCSPIGFEEGRIPLFDVDAFPADENLSALAVRAHDLAGLGTTCHRGRIASGDQFIAGAEQKNHIVSRFGASCAEMEGASVGQAAYMNGVPFAVIRAISDKADGSASMDYGEFERVAANHEVAIIEQMMRLLS